MWRKLPASVIGPKVLWLQRTQARGAHLALAFAILVMMVVAVLAAYVPARRAMDPERAHQRDI